MILHMKVSKLTLHRIVPVGHTKRHLNTGTWRWAESHHVPEYLNWGTDQPNGGEHCVFKIAGSLLWYDYTCTKDIGSNYGISTHTICETSS